MPANGGTYAVPAGLSIVLIALHSIVDYQLRTPTGIVLFAILLTLFFSGSSGKKRVRVRATDSVRWGKGHDTYHFRSEERRVGKECVSTCRSRGARLIKKKTKKKK